MMAFFTHYWKSNNPLFLLTALCLFFSSVVWATALSIKSAEFVLVEDSYALNAEIEPQFSEEVKTALSKGVALHFLVECQISAVRKYWFDDEIVTVSKEVSLSYHALSRQFLLTSGQEHQTFATLDEAIVAFSHIKGWKVITKKELEMAKDEVYKAALRVRLNQTKLPKPLQIEALHSENWNMVSERYQWVPNFN